VALLDMESTESYLSFGLHPIRQTVKVTFEYGVHFTRDLFAPSNPLFYDVVATDAPSTPRNVLFAIERGVADATPGLSAAILAYCRRYPRSIDVMCAPLLVDGGEAAKNSTDAVARIQQAVNEHGLDRQSMVVAIGGGALLDVVGYAAATAHRGIRLIRVPTTVLAQADSGVGVKNGINAYGKKNFLGTFAPPFAVLNDFSFLDTLPDREWRGGVSEAVKVALLKDAEFFRYLEQNADPLVQRDTQTMERVIHRCAELHLQHIANSGDPFEMGSSRPLDFGHWAAHKLEQLSDFGLRHGEAVAIGLALDATYSRLAGMLSEGDWRRILTLLSRLGFSLYAPELSRHLGDRSDLRCPLTGLDEFREHLGGELTVMLLEGIGRGVEVHEIDEARMIASITRLSHTSATSWRGQWLQALGPAR
jgi:3-dehydroquinate synthase